MSFYRTSHNVHIISMRWLSYQEVEGSTDMGFSGLIPKLIISNQGRYSFAVKIYLFVSEFRQTSDKIIQYRTNNSSTALKYNFEVLYLSISFFFPCVCVCVCVRTGVDLSNGCCGLKDQQQEEVHDGPAITPTHTLHLWEREREREMKERTTELIITHELVCGCWLLLYQLWT